MFCRVVQDLWLVSTFLNEILVKMDASLIVFLNSPSWLIFQFEGSPKALSNEYKKTV